MHSITTTKYFGTLMEMDTAHCTFSELDRQRQVTESHSEAIHDS